MEYVLVDISQPVGERWISLDIQNDRQCMNFQVLNNKLFNWIFEQLKNH